MNCVITSANIFSGQSAVTSRIFPVQSAVSVRKSTPGRPFMLPILKILHNYIMTANSLLLLVVFSTAALKQAQTDVTHGFENGTPSDAEEMDV